MRQPMTAPDRWQKINLVALALALAVLAATGLAWWRDRARTFEAPRWDAARFVQLASPQAIQATQATQAPLTPQAPPSQTAAVEPLEHRERWVVAVSLACPHCQQHLRALAVRTAGRAQPPALAALIVDQPARPVALDLGVVLAGGAWWDSTQVWRESWGRRAYGETFRFGARGELLSSTPAGVVPDSADVVM